VHGPSLRHAQPGQRSTEIRILMRSCLVKLAFFFVSFAVSVDGAAILLSLLKELQKQSQAVGQLASISSKWCSDAAHEETGVSQVMQGQLDDATIAVQQIRSDEKRLESELALALATQRQREQQLQDATSTSSFAAAEFSSEQQQLNSTIDACQHGMRLLKAQIQMDTSQQEQLGSADAIVNNLLQTGGDHMTEDEKNIMTEYASDPKPSQTSAAGARPQELLTTLTKLHDRLKKEQTLAFQEQQVMSLRLWSFTDHLSSSIMESKSQAASISMEMAQRKREHTRLDGKIAALTALLSKVEVSKQAVSTACTLDSKRSSEIQKFIAEESDSVRTTLKKMPSLSSELLFDLNTVLPTAPSFPSFLQVRSKSNAAQEGKDKLHNPVDPIVKDLDMMSQKFPAEASMFADAKKDVMSQKSVMPDIQDDSKPSDSIHGFASSSIQDIYAFLKSDDQGGGASLPSEEKMLLSSSGDLGRVTSIYQKLLDQVEGKEKTVDDQLKWCGSIARDAKVDADAVARSLKWTDAKLNLVRVAEKEYNRSVAFSKEQQKIITDRSAKLVKLADVESGQLQQSYNALKEYGQQLISLQTELEQKTSVEERKGVEVVKALLEKVDRHQGMLTRWQAESKNLREAVTAAFKDVSQEFANGAKQSSRRMVRLKVESQVLASLTSAKAKDKQLSERYVQLSQQLCSGSKAKELQAKGAKLREEATAVQKSLTALTQPLA